MNRKTRILKRVLSFALVFVMVMAMMPIKAEAAKTYTVYFVAGEGGTVSETSNEISCSPFLAVLTNSDNSTLKLGTPTDVLKTVTATANPGYKFVGWSHNVGTDFETSFMSSCTITFTATFRQSLSGSGTEADPYLVATADELSSAAGLGGFIKLNADITSNLTVDNGKSITLDLNGHTLTGTGSGSVITNNGTLTIKDSSTGGTITGGSAENGGGINNTGTLTITGGTITGNSATSKGGGIYSATSITLGGNASVTSNTCNSDACNLYLPNNITAIVSSGFSGSVGITTETAPAADAPVAIYSSADDYSSCFTSDKSGYAFVFNNNSLTLNVIAHSWAYTANGNVLTAKCSGASGGCTYETCGHDTDATAVSLTLTANSAAYTGAQYSSASLTNTEDWTGLGLTLPEI